MKGKYKARRNTAIRLIRKQARGFNIGETIYLFGDELELARHGSFVIEEMKYYTDNCVTIFTKNSQDRYTAFQFAPNEYIHRLSGARLDCIIREAEELL